MSLLMICLILSSILSVLFFFYKLYDKKLEADRRNSLLDRYPTLMVLLETSSEVSYSKMFKSDISVYINSEVNIDNKTLKELTRTFIRLTWKICGPEVMDDLIDLRGDLDSWNIYLGNIFVDRLLKDESDKKIDVVRKTLSPPEKEDTSG